MKKEFNYYRNELDKIVSCKNITFKFFGRDSETRNLNLNLESIKELKKFINKIINGWFNHLSINIFKLADKYNINN